MRMLRLIFLLLMESGPGLPLRPLILQLPGLHTFTKHKVDSYSYDAFQVELQTKVREDFTITEKAPTFETLPVPYDLCPNFMSIVFCFTSIIPRRQNSGIRFML